MGRAPCCDKANVKKGPWSPEEDAKLKDFIEKYGTGGNWIALPQKAGLKRCGKSCRLRWLNYLRPNIKHGEFSDDEDRIICTLYASIGSRWSIIAAQLPGRTDNDIKNYWNTKLKKKLMGMNHIPAIQGKYNFLPFSGSQFHNSLSTLSNLYTSFYSQATKSLSAMDSITSVPQSYLFNPNNINTNNHLLLTHNYNPQNQEGMMDILPYGYTPLKENNNMLMFGGNEPSCSSSDGSIQDHIKQEEMGYVANGLMQENQQKFMLYYNGNKGSNGIQNNVDPLFTTSSSSYLDHDQEKHGINIMGGPTNTELQYDLEEVKNLVSTTSGNVCNNNNSNNGNNVLLFNDHHENKTHEREMYYY